MSTAVVRCPYCGSMLRVAVQPSRIIRTDPGPSGDQLKVSFDEQKVAHICRDKE